MINYIEYLNYWRQPEYSRHLRYPQCLATLELLKYESFREAIANQSCARFIEDQLILNWQRGSRGVGMSIEEIDKMNKEKREKEKENEKENEDQNGLVRTNYEESDTPMEVSAATVTVVTEKS